MVDRSEAGSCIIEIKANNKKLKVTIMRQPRGEIWMTNTTAREIVENIGLDGIEYLKKYAEEEFEKELNEIQRKVTREDWARFRPTELLHETEFTPEDEEALKKTS